MASPQIIVDRWHVARAYKTSIFPTSFDPLCLAFSSWPRICPFFISFFSSHILLTLPIQNDFYVFQFLIFFDLFFLRPHLFDLLLQICFFIYVPFALHWSSFICPLSFVSLVISRCTFLHILFLPALARVYCGKVCSVLYSGNPICLCYVWLLPMF